MKTALIIRHVPREGVAGFREPIEAAGYVIDRVDVDNQDFHALDLVAPDLVVMMGGPMGVYEREAHPWISCQLKLLARRLAADRPMLGVCFGSQMIAAALGADVYPGPTKEIGFAPVTIHDRDGPLRHLSDVPVLHWHGDTFTLPEGAELLASSPAYQHQAFRKGRNVLALQFHAEMGEDERFVDWIAQDMDYLTAAGQCPDELRAAHEVHGPRAVAAGRAMIAEWLTGLV
ncbi:MAG: glutamine amidotransferase [Novosphingobium sp.]|uniref:glutamine amidotransferase n=1 Tax=Novosphingobium sp. TaxID=1874826 RepID=UPI003017EA0C